MSNMKISIRLRRETGLYMIINTLCQILINLLLDKIFRDNRLKTSFSFSIARFLRLK